MMALVSYFMPFIDATSACCQLHLCPLLTEDRLLRVPSLALYTTNMALANSSLSERFCMSLA